MHIGSMMTAWEVALQGGRIRVGERFAISFQRTLRIPDDGRLYPLPPTLGQFPVCWAAEYSSNLPAEWGLESDSLAAAFFIPMYQREALWLAFEAAAWKPNAVKIGVGRVNALTGEAWQAGLHADPQDYIVCPNQMWLDGFKTQAGSVRQFVAMPLGMGYTVEAQLTGQEIFGGIQVQVFDPHAGLFMDEPPLVPAADALPESFMGGRTLELLEPGSAPGMATPLAALSPAPAGDLGLAPGGEIIQKIYPDPYGLQTWDASHTLEVQVFIVNIPRYLQITGQVPPPSPIDAQTYTRYGFPWFELYEADQADLPPSAGLSSIKSVAEMDSARQPGQTSESESVEIPAAQKHTIHPSNQSPSADP